MKPRKLGILVSILSIGIAMRIGYIMGYGDASKKLFDSNTQSTQLAETEYQRLQGERDEMETKWMKCVIREAEVL